MSFADQPNDSPVHSFLSPEAVRLDLPVSGPAPRMLAYGIDVLIMYVVVFLLIVFVIMSMSMGAAIEHSFREGFEKAKAAGSPDPRSLGYMQGLLLAIFLLAEFVIETGYFIFWEVVTGGRSPGKLIVGLRVVRRNGAPIDLRSSIVRNLMRIVDLLPAEYLVGLISIILSSSGERLGDHVAGTVVIRLDRPEAAPEINLENSVAIVLTREQLARIGPRELQLIRTALRRSQELPESRRALLLAEVAEAMRDRLELDQIPTGDSLTFLRSLLATAERSLRD